MQHNFLGRADPPVGRPLHRPHPQFQTLQKALQTSLHVHRNREGSKTDQVHGEGQLFKGQVPDHRFRRLPLPRGGEPVSDSIELEGRTRRQEAVERFGLDTAVFEGGDGFAQEHEPAEAEAGGAAAEEKGEALTGIFL